MLHMRFILFILSAALLASCSGFTQRKYLERNFHGPALLSATSRSTHDEEAAEFPPAAQCKNDFTENAITTASPEDTIIPPDTAAPKNIFDKFRAVNDADRARRAVKSGMLSVAGSLVYYLSSRLTLTHAVDAGNGQSIVAVFLVLIPLCFLIGMLAIAFGMFALFRGFRVKKNNKGEKNYEGRHASTAGILLGLMGILLTIAATILLRQL
jgi:hypothetical protein